MAGLTDWVSTLPDGLDTLISENGKNLSGGQRQRIGIARLALRRYDLIIADEITASLDPDTSGQIMENLLALPCMVVAITHDVSGAFMKQFDKVYRWSTEASHKHKRRACAGFRHRPSSCFFRLFCRVELGQNILRGSRGHELTTAQTASETRKAGSSS